MKKHGFVQAKKTDDLFTHVLRDILFTLVVDDFGIQYTNKQDCDYLIRIMTEKYKFQVDYDAKQYIGIHLQWDYYKREVVCSISQGTQRTGTYIPKEALLRTTEHSATNVRSQNTICRRRSIETTVTITIQSSRTYRM